MNKVIQGDCLEKLKELEDNSVDSIVTDPPYHLVSIVKRFGKEGSAPAKEGTDGSFKRLSAGFMGKEWDGVDENGMGIAMNVEMWKECLRVLKPGGHLLAFSGTRTYHRMAVAIEDAGFEVRDMIEWVYGSGFPKSLNIGKAVDKLQGNERVSTGEIKHHSQKGVVIAEERGAIGGGAFGQAKDEEITKGTSKWEGWGTALKPAHEPICMARKPIGEKTVAENCLKWGTGGIAIDESRVESSENTVREIKNVNREWGGLKNPFTGGSTNGRFPANLIHDGSDEVKECFPEQKSGARSSKHEIGNEDGEMFNHGIYGKYKAKNYDDAPAESGNASRFFKGIPQVVDLHDFSIYNRSILTNIKQLCGQHLTKKRIGIMLDGVIQEVEKFIQDAELLMSGNNATTEKFLTDIASITKILIAQMTELKTLNVLPNWLIIKFTEESEQTIKSLKELNTEDVKSAKSIFLLQTFINEVLESIKAIAEIVVEKDLNNGEYKSLVYIPKASKSERNKGMDDLELKEWKQENSPNPNREERPFLPVKNNHPTVKPIALMEYLIKMVTPKGGTVLDPFAGSGSTLVACKQNGFQYIGIEKELEYIKIIEARLKK